METHFAAWRAQAATKLKALTPGCHPKTIITELAESLLAHYTGKPLIDNYDVYQHLMDYWSATMQDDCYLIAADGWKAETYRVIETNKKGKDIDKGWACDLIPRQLVIDRYFATEQAAIHEQQSKLETLAAQMTELEEEHGGEEGLFSELEKMNKANVTARLKEINGDKEAKDEAKALNAWLTLCNDEADLKKALREAETTLDVMAYTKYPKLTEAEIKMLVVEDKWMTSIASDIHGEMDRVSQALTHRVKELGDRYGMPMPRMSDCIDVLEAQVNQHLKKMGFAWK